MTCWQNLYLRSSASIGGCKISEGGAIQYVLRRRKRVHSDEELLKDLRQVADFVGRKSVRCREYRHYGRYCSSAVIVRFGSWNNALQAAGLQINRRENIPNHGLFENLERVWQALGRQPKRAEMKKPLSAFCSGTYERRFSGWGHALEAFVTYANGPRSPGDTDLIERRERKKPLRSPSARLRYAVLRRDLFKCQACGRSPATDPAIRLHVDHKIPWKLGGPTTFENLTTLCERCNLGKGSSNP